MLITNTTMIKMLLEVGWPLIYLGHRFYVVQLFKKQRFIFPFIIVYERKEKRK